MRMSLELKSFYMFQVSYDNNEFLNQRYGQAFCNYFGLHKVNMPVLKEKFNKLYNEEDDSKTISIIKEIFEFN